MCSNESQYLSKTATTPCWVELSNGGGGNQRWPDDIRPFFLKFQLQLHQRHHLQYHNITTAALIAMTTKTITNTNTTITSKTTNKITLPPPHTQKRKEEKNTLPSSSEWPPSELSKEDSNNGPTSEPTILSQIPSLIPPQERHTRHGVAKDRSESWKRTKGAFWSPWNHCNILKDDVAKRWWEDHTH